MSNLDEAIAQVAREGEAFADRILRLEFTEEKGFRQNNTAWKEMEAAHPFVTDKVLGEIAKAAYVSKKPTIVLPAHRFESLSRGRGWARKGKGATAVWGERVEGGYEVGPGRWEVGGHDGFNRKKSDTYDVKHIQVGAETWTVAN